MQKVKTKIQNLHEADSLDLKLVSLSWRRFLVGSDVSVNWYWTWNIFIASLYSQIAFVKWKTIFNNRSTRTIALEFIADERKKKVKWRWNLDLHF